MNKIDDNTNPDSRESMPASKSLRLAAYVIDSFAIGVLQLVLIMILLGIHADTFQIILTPQLFSCFLFLIKDITGRSPGKILLHLRIVKRSNPGIAPNPAILVFRNVLFALGPVEPVVLLLNSDNKRIADMITDSMVIVVPQPAKIQSDVDLIGPIVDDLSDPSECVSCGAQIPANEYVCPKCGWSYRDVQPAP